MRLLIVSHTPHFRRGRSLVGWGATVREIDHLATLFDEIVHLAPLYSGSPPSSALSYQATNVRVRPVTPAGGTSIFSKVGVLFRVPAWAAAIRREARQADVVHVRCPANISFLALVMLFLMRHPRPRWVKYAGNWRPTANDPCSYRLQRWLLRQSGHGAVVTVNGRWPDERDHVVSFANPCLTQQELRQGREITATKALQEPVRLCFVGRLEPAKGAERALRILRQLNAGEVTSTVTFVGSGDLLPQLTEKARAWGLESSVQFSGWVPRSELPSILSRSHFVVLPTSASEGFPKALAEGMAFGAVPIAGAVSSIPQFLRDTGAGVAIDPQDEKGFVDAIIGFVRNVDLWSEAVENGLAAARLFSYDAYLEDVVEILETKFNCSLNRERLPTVGAS
ncbi:MAG: glycosyltransferase family 4 protein [Thermoanaerobaculia bacterium]